jgi:hypothetical protein
MTPNDSTSNVLCWLLPSSDSTAPSAAMLFSCGDSLTLLLVGLPLGRELRKGEIKNSQILRLKWKKEIFFDPYPS